MGRILIIWLMLMSAPSRGQATEGVVLLHGLARTPRSMRWIEKDLAKAGYVVVNLGYASRKSPIEELSEDVYGRVCQAEALRGCERIHFVTHSMGGIVVRQLLSRHPLDRLGRVVMLAPPNGGSEVVDRLGSWRLFRWINGPAGGQLGTGSDSLPNRLGAVTYEVGVIAGDRTINWINSWMIPGPDDGKVSVERTKVSGMKAHLVLHTTHPTMLVHRGARAAVVAFLRTGRFGSDRGGGM